MSQSCQALSNNPLLIGSKILTAICLPKLAFLSRRTLGEANCAWSVGSVWDKIGDTKTLLFGQTNRG